jgi:TolB-like protein/Tfp pilus assembly protein PilF
MGLFAELQRRNVFRVAIAYAVIAWLVMQVGDTMAPALRLGDWVNSVLAFFLILGFPIVIFFAWVFEMTPEGLKFERDVDRSQSITGTTAKKVDRLIIVVLALAVAYFAFDKFVLDPARDAEEIQAATEAAPTEPSISDQSIAVLPFADLSPTGDQEYFSDGIAEEILNVLVRVQDLTVASRTSSFGFKGQEALGIPAIAEKLKVRHVLEGSVRKAGDTVRITAQLIDAQTDAHLWSDTYDRKLTAENIFAIQDEIAQAIVSKLGILIEDHTVEAGTLNLTAYELYLKAHKRFLERSRVTDIVDAIDLFEQSVVVDPEFGRATAGLAAAYAVAPSWGAVDRDYFTLAIDAANEAIALDPDSAMAYTVSGYVAMEQYRYEDAFALFDTAMQLDDTQPTQWLWRGILNNSLGYFERAKSDIDRCIALDPAYVNCLRHRARASLFSGEIDEALALIERAWLQGFGTANSMFLAAYAARGNHSVVIASLAAAYGPLGYHQLIDYEYRAITDPDFDLAAERDEIEAVHKAVTGRDLDWSVDDTFNPLIFRAYAEISTDFGNQVWWHPYPEDFGRSLHKRRLILGAGLPDYWRKHGFPPHCRPVGDDDFACDAPVVRAREDEKKPAGAPR